MKTQLEYRKAFIILFISKLFGLASGFVMIAVLLYKFKNIMGWTRYEIFFIYSLDMFSYAFIGQFLMRPCARLANYIRTGEFDTILTKPMNNFFYYIFREFSTGYFSNLLLCIVIIIISLRMLSIPFTFANIAFLIMTIIGASLIQGAFFLFATIPSFWLVKNDSLSNFLLWDMKRFIQYPISIYHIGIQILLTFVLPYAFINFIPAQYLLNKNACIITHPVVPFLTPVIGIVLFFSAYKFWKIGVNNYKSTGS